MTERLIQLLARVKELLLNCGLSHRAEWFADLETNLKDVSIENEEMRKMLDKLDSVLGGMGSFTDIPLTPTVNGLTVEQARDLQWELAEKIGKEIQALKKKAE